MRRCAKFSSHANGVWLTQATATLTSFMGGLPVGFEMLDEEACGARDLQEAVLQRDGARVRVRRHDATEQARAAKFLQRRAWEQSVRRDRIDRHRARIAIRACRIEQRAAG